MHASHGPFIFGSVVGLLVAMHMSPVSVRTPIENAEPAVMPAVSVPQSEPGTVRLGVYDSRGIAVAWVGSPHNDLGARKDEHRRAEEAGDAAKAAALERWGIMKQRELHFQGFGTYPVDRYIADIKDQLPALMSRRELDAIVWMTHARADGVETVDVTVDLMVLLGMDRNAAEHTHQQMRTHDPLDFATLFELDPRE